ncbi:carbon monoxide dehydrogenase maturation protein [Actinomadura darangshiensis]|uniref:Carbon monoxide dehydrogenase maturation protein n=1 Tax=Actinomadura darangshiensis TaxID=705336 RepID=A0A4R5A5C3_9ACTN|nr:carbon monoxide dehydrogenase maturation protein [Actinomadura darangshiensis]TDD67228.1 carbon monoxide dehydrogenase maturation protein [Actinomadura darangshiensis]
MPVLALCSIKGSPGVTTTAIALAGSWRPRPATVVECDAAGGDIAAAMGLPSEPGLVGLAAAVRRKVETGHLDRHTQQPSVGLEVVPAPVGPGQASAAIHALADSGLVPNLAADPRLMVIADCGRLDPGSPSRRVLGQATRALVLIRPRGEDLAHLAPQIPTLQTIAPSLELLLVGPAEYSAKEITATLRIPVAGHLPRDSRSATILLRQGFTLRGTQRLPLVRSACSVAGQLAGRVHATGRERSDMVTEATPLHHRMVGRP